MTVTERTYEQIALDDPKGRWELHRGRMRRKPAMSFGHNDVRRKLTRSLILQLNPNEYVVSVDASRVRRGDDTVYIPDLFVIPASYLDDYRDRRRSLEVYENPIPLVVEVWSPSTGDYDVETKLPEYMARGDLETWRVHPFERTLTAWRKRPDGSYEETVVSAGVFEPVALPGVRIDLDALFA